MAKRKVLVHYRRVTDRDFRSLTPSLRDCLETSLASQISGIVLKDSDSARITTTSDGKRMCLLFPDTYKTAAVGEIAVFRDGDIPVAQADEDGKIQLRTIALNGNELAVQGSSFFMVKNGHLAVLHIESTTRILEEYFRWILRAPIGPLPQDEIVRLVPLLSVGGKSIGLQEVTALTIRGAVRGQSEMFSRAEVKSLGVSEKSSFRKMIERAPLSASRLRQILSNIGLTSGALNQLSEDDLEEIQLDLVLRSRKKNKDIVPRDIIQAILNDGLESATEFRAPGTRRRGEALTASFSGDLTTNGAYVDPQEARSLMWDALTAWERQGLIS